MRLKPAVFTLFLVGLAVILAAFAAPRVAMAQMGDCIVGCNEECASLNGNEKRLCKLACFAGRCEQPGAIEAAETNGEAGITCDQDGMCNEFCAEGADPDCAPMCEVVPFGEAVCGNGVLELYDPVIFPEFCDDGNLMDGDGCSSTCRLESQCRLDMMPSCYDAAKSTCDRIQAELLALKAAGDPNFHEEVASYPMTIVNECTGNVESLLSHTMSYMVPGTKFGMNYRLFEAASGIDVIRCDENRSDGTTVRSQNLCVDSECASFNDNALDACDNPCFK